MDFDNLRDYDTTPVSEKVEQEAKLERVEKVVDIERTSATPEVVQEQLRPNPTPQTVNKRTTQSADGNTYNDYTFNEGSTVEDFRALAQEGSRVASPTDFYVVEKGTLKSTRSGTTTPFPTNPQGWSISNKVEILSDQNTKSIQNKKCK